MTVKELITRLLEEDVNGEVCLQTTDSRFADEENKKGRVIFNIENVERWGGDAYLNFTDWRVNNEK